MTTYYYSGKTPGADLARIDAHGHAHVLDSIGKKIGFGRLQQIVEVLWAMHLREAGLPMIGALIAQQPVGGWNWLETLREKLQRFDDCAQDGEDCDIGRPWLDALTLLGLLRRTQHRPALWTMMEAGEALLTVPKAAQQQAEPLGKWEVDAFARLHKTLGLTNDVDPLAVLNHAIMRIERLESEPRLPDAARDVFLERVRQQSEEGWTPEHDDEHGGGEMAEAAICYIQGYKVWHPSGLHQRWPWALDWWKPRDRRRNLVKAGALILAEIERLDRAAAPKQQQERPAEIRGADIPATMRHDAGAYARCHYCGRYSDNPKSLSRDNWPCDCGKPHGWCGSFKKPTAESQWSAAAPTKQEVQQ